MFSLFNHSAPVNAVFNDIPVRPLATQLASAEAGSACDREPGAGKPLSYDELLPYLMLSTFAAY